MFYVFIRNDTPKEAGVAKVIVGSRLKDLTYHLDFN
jgi:hypothetical protein